MTDHHLLDEYIPLACLLFKLRFHEIANLMAAIPMYSYDEFDQLRPLTDGEVAATRAWLAGFAKRYQRANENEATQIDLDLYSEDAVSNINGFVLTDLMGIPHIRAAYADATSALGAMLKAFRAEADAGLQVTELNSILPAHLTHRAQALDTAKPRDRVMGLHVLSLIADHERGDAGSVANLERATLAKRVVADIARLRLTMPNGQPIRSLKGGGPLAEETVIRDVITKFKLLG